MYNANVTSMNNLQVQIANTNQQMSTGLRILSPADDPAGAARAAELTQTDAANTQYTANRTAATNTLSLSDGILQSVTSLIQDAQTTVLTATNSTLTDASRKALATSLQSNLQELLGLANSTNGAGSYLYSGAQGSVKPFANTASGVVYQGDDVQRNVQVSASRQISSSDSGADIFMRIRNGNGTFQTAAVATNTGSGIISQGTATDSALYNNGSYQVAFTVGGTTTYSVTDVSTGLPVAGMTNVPYVSGQAISFNGVQFAVTGTPANGDTFNITPSSNQSVFETLNKLIDTLNIPLSGATTAVVAANTQALSDGTAALTQDLNNVLGVLATTGSRLNELTASQTTGDLLGVQYKKTLSSIESTDYTQAASNFAQEKLALEAAQQSFAQVAKLSLFNYL
jgi:flagellar hook-associated protein 3 FlgL